MVPATPLHRPVAFFSDPPEETEHLGVVVAVVIGTGALMGIAIYAMGVEVASQVEGTITVVNPDYPGDANCAAAEAGEFPEGAAPSGCDEGRFVERDPAPYVRDAFAEAAMYVAIGWGILWFVGSTLLHVAAKIAGGEGSMPETLAIGAWSGLPLALTTLPSAVLVAVSIQSRELTLEGRGQEIEAAVAPLEPVLLGLAVVGALWQMAVWYGGLRGSHVLDRRRAGVVTAVFGVASFGFFFL